MEPLGILVDVATEVMRERRAGASRPRHAPPRAQSEMRVRWKPRAEREGVGPRWPW